MPSKTWVSLPIMLYLCTGVPAQRPELSPLPSHENQQQMLSRLNAYIATYKPAMPPLKCVQPFADSPDSVEGSSRAPSTVTVDFDFEDKRKQSGLGAVVDVDFMLRNLFASEGPATFRRWASLRGQRVAMVQEQNANIYFDPDSGKISRIVFRGVDKAARFAKFYCWTI